MNLKTSKLHIIYYLLIKILKVNQIENFQINFINHQQLFPYVSWNVFKILEIQKLTHEHNNVLTTDVKLENLLNV